MQPLQKPPELTDIGHPVKMLVNFMELRVIQSDDGHKIIKLRTKEHQAINVYILYLQIVHDYYPYTNYKEKNFLIKV